GVDLFQRVTAALGHNEMAGVAATCADGFLSVGRNVVAIMTTKTTVPIFVSNEIGMGLPIRIYFGKEVGAINRLRLLDDWVRLRGVRISCAQGVGNLLLGFASCFVRLNQCRYNFGFNPWNFGIEPA